jgi:SEL1 protein
LREREEEEELLGSHHRHADNEDTGYYDEIEFDIDESALEALIIAALAATLLILVYIRQLRNRPRDNNEGQPAGNGVNNNGNDRGLFPRQDQPEFVQWAAGGVGH